MDREPLENRIRKCLDRHPDWPDDRIARAIRGGSRAAVKAVREGRPLDLSKFGVPLEPAEPAQPGTIMLSQIRKRYDIAQAIREAIAGLAAGQLILERELCQQTAGKDIARFRRTVENTDDLRPFRVKLKLDQDKAEGAWYWGRREDVAEAIRLRDE